MAVEVMGMHVRVGPSGGYGGRGLMLNGHLLPIPTGGPRWTDGGKGDTEGWSKRRGDRWTGHVVVTNTDRVTDMEHMMMMMQSKWLHVLMCSWVLSTHTGEG